MGDSNAWDMLEHSQERKSSSPRRDSQRGVSETVERKAGVFQQMIKLDEAELQALGLAKEDIAEEAERQRTESRKRRSKSPALESIRKVSLHVLQKFGAISKKKEAYLPLYKDTELDLIPLESCCVRPKEFFREPAPFSFRELGRAHVLHCEPRQEKCQDFLAKIIRKKKREMLSGNEKIKVNKVMQKIRANLLIISVAFLFLFSAFNGLSNLQTSVNNELGADSLAYVVTFRSIAT
ncbi:unnamed protein product [Nippostrongylus brasiliensis]|uniref:Ion_trans_2 domain-containing protein n=1 Tax=Nippostrongylus brasiliensis TaxID=27835 RepID=A0A0N4XFT9_NIPBR|nr:unnamed protein product [Nippostrongylus brasiliensis]